MFQITAALQSDGQCQQTGDCRTEETVVWSAVSDCSSSAAATHQIREQWCHSTGDQTHGAQVWPGGETESDRWVILWWLLINFYLAQSLVSMLLSACPSMFRRFSWLLGTSWSCWSLPVVWFLSCPSSRTITMHSLDLWWTLLELMFQQENTGRSVPSQTNNNQ